ncbi:hypothetical protein HNY73_006744 [Argiope bruennichi]|uniref:Uncharacterized protein n=1 Tax=Argiope bruennichi TaxID=94029 RepID=A0A8T0FET4_ARGBR|nr:hypothetical protein HNY73_006744 [Argiope bruennichi]
MHGHRDNPQGGATPPGRTNSAGTHKPRLQRTPRHTDTYTRKSHWTHGNLPTAYTQWAYKIVRSPVTKPPPAAPPAKRPALLQPKRTPAPAGDKLTPYRGPHHKQEPRRTAIPTPQRDSRLKEPPTLLGTACRSPSTKKLRPRHPPGTAPSPPRTAYRHRSGTNTGPTTCNSTPTEQNDTYTPKPHTGAPAGPTEEKKNPPRIPATTPITRI